MRIHMYAHVCMCARICMHARTHRYSLCSAKTMFGSSSPSQRRLVGSATHTCRSRHSSGGSVLMYAACCMLHAACCVLRAVCGVLRAACYICSTCYIFAGSVWTFCIRLAPHTLQYCATMCHVSHMDMRERRVVQRRCEGSGKRRGPLTYPAASRQSSERTFFSGGSRGRSCRTHTDAYACLTNVSRTTQTKAMTQMVQ